MNENETWNTCPACGKKWPDKTPTPQLMHRTRLCDECIGNKSDAGQQPERLLARLQREAEQSPAGSVVHDCLTVLQDLAEAEKGTSRGPWEIQELGRTYITRLGDPYGIEIMDADPYPHKHLDAEFIVHAKRLARSIQ
jgi:hypothetical protein